MLLSCLFFLVKVRVQGCTLALLHFGLCKKSSAIWQSSYQLFIFKSMDSNGFSIFVASVLSSFMLFYFVCSFPLETKLHICRRCLGMKNGFVSFQCQSHVKRISVWFVLMVTYSQICYTRSCTYHLLLVFLSIQFLIQSIYFLVSHCIITCFALNNNKHTHAYIYIVV